METVLKEQRHLKRAVEDLTKVRTGGGEEASLPQDLDLPVSTMTKMDSLHQYLINAEKEDQLVSVHILRNIILVVDCCEKNLNVCCG